LASDGDGGAKLEASSIPVEMRCMEHDAGVNFQPDTQDKTATKQQKRSARPMGDPLR